MRMQAYIAEGTYRKRLLRLRTIECDGDTAPYVVTNSDGSEYIREGPPAFDGKPIYVPDYWLETAGEDDSDEYPE